MVRRRHGFRIAAAATMAIAGVFGLVIATSSCGCASPKPIKNRASPPIKNRASPPSEKRASTPTGTVTTRGTPYIVTGLLEGSTGRLRSIYGTFSSHAQRIAYVPGKEGGVFVGWLYSDAVTDRPCFTDPPPVNASCGSAVIQIARTTDNGATWTPLLKIGVGGHWPPTLEADKAGNVYAFVNSWGLADTIVYKFPAGDYSDPTIQARLTGGATGKSTSSYDPYTNEFYYVKGDFTAGDDFRLFRFSTSATGIIAGSNLLTAAPLNGYRVYPHYPTMDVARDGSGLTVLAWTNTYASGIVRPGCSRDYYDIHYLVSEDHGRHWYGKQGLISASPFPAGFPVDATNSGPSFALLDPSELSTSCPDGNPHSNWLENVYTQDDKLFFVYGNAAQGKETYRRVAWNPRTHTGTNDLGPTVLTRLENFTGFFSGNGTANAPIYFTSAGSSNRIIILDSVNDGATWNTYARSDRPSWGLVYAVSGGHYLGPSGEILGAFTDSVAHDVWFFRTGWQVSAVVGRGRRSPR